MRQLIEHFIKYPIWANAIIFLVVVGGIISAFTIKKSFFPEIEPNYVFVQVAYPGASPEEMEEGVVLKVEQALQGIQGIEEVTSTASENTASITVEVNDDYDLEIVLADVKNAVDRINSFPESAEKPVVYSQKPRSDVIDMILVGEVNLNTLKRYAEGIEDDLLASGDISEISITGFPDREISIEVAEETLIRYGLTFDQVGNAVRLNNRDISSGSVKSPEEEVLIRSRAKRTDAKGIGNIIVRTNDDGSILRLKDVAEIKEQFADVPNKTLYNGQLAVTLNISKFPEDDILEITEYVKAYTKEFNENNQTVQIVLDNDRSDYLLARLNILQENGIMGLTLVLIFLGMFLSLRLSFWVAFGIPFSFLGMLIIATMMGVTINIMSLFGMILVVGILVDDGIVVGENMFSHFEKGKTPLHASIDGTLEVLPAVFTGVTTTMVAFSAFFFMEGRFGSFVVELAIVVILCLAFSLIECTFILPPHIAHSGALTRKAPSGFRKWFDVWFRFFRDKVYGRMLVWIVRYRYITLAAALFLSMVMVGLVQGQYLRLTFFPSFSRSDNIDIGLTLDPGTREFRTEAILKDIERKVWAFSEQQSEERKDGRDLVVSTRLSIGSSSTGRGGGGESGGHTGRLRVELLPEEVRGVSKFVITRQLSQMIGEVPEAKELTIGNSSFFGKPVSLSMKSRNLEELEGAKNMVKTALSQRPDLKDITDSNIPGKREVNIQLKPLAYVLGLTHNDITRQIRQGFFGEEVQRLQIGQDEVRVWLRYPPENRKSLGEMEAIKIKTEDGREFPLTDLIEYDIERGIVAIKHLNRARESRIEAEMADQSEPVQPVLAELRENLVPKVREAYPGVSISFEGQARQGERFSGSFVIAAPLILMGIYILISLAFRSFLQSGLIILMIPLGILGAFIGHYIEGKPVSILSSYGIVALSGVIVNDAVVFLDKFNRLMKSGHTVAMAIFYAGKARYRPIILTSLTTVVGLFPLIRDTSSTAQFLVPMAIAIAYGVLIGTFFILTVFPALVVATNDLRLMVESGKRFVWSARTDFPSRMEVETAVREEKKLEELV